MNTFEGKVNGNEEISLGEGRRHIWQIMLMVALVLLATAGVMALVWKLSSSSNKMIPVSASELTDTDAELTGTDAKQEVSAENITEEVTTPEEITTQQETTTQPETTTAEPETTVPAQPPEPIVFDDTGDTKYAYLTFDDGPSDNTYPILDILDQYQVKATFFVNGREDIVSLDRYRAMVNKGHALGLHSYTHDYNGIYASLDAFKSDTERIHDLIYRTTGKDVKLYRFPGGSSNTITNVPIQTFTDYLTSLGYIYYDWNVSSGDATGQPITAETIAYNVLEQSKGCTRAMILMHDGVKKGETVKALPAIIEGLQAQGFQIVPITESTRPIQHVKAIYMQ